MGGTRNYLRLLAPSVPVSAGEKSSVLPVGSAAPISAGYNLALRTVTGSSTFLEGGWSPASTAHYDNFMARFATEPLAAQTIAADNWTLAIETKETNANANSFTVCSLYVYRPSTDAVVGYVYDSDSPLGAEWGLTQFGQVLTLVGAQVIAANNDILVLEIWRHTAGQAVATIYDHELYIDGPTPVTAGSTSAGGSYLETLNSLTLFSGGGATIEGAIASTLPGFTVFASGSATGGRVGTVAIAFPAFSVSASGTVGVASPPAEARGFNPGYAWTTQQLIDAINANTRYTTCPLDHSDAPTSYHKEPLLPAGDSENALTPAGYVRTVVHEKDPAGIYYTTYVAEKT